MPRNAVDFVKDFFFTDIMNHVEFMKYIHELEKDDDVLLIGILERLASDDPPLQVQRPFYGSLTTHKYLPKNPLNIAKAYGHIQDLGGHEYNIFEFAYLAPELYGTKAYLALFIQVSFFLTLLTYNVFEELVIITPGERGFSLVVLIMLISTALFYVTIRNQFRECRHFCTTMKALSGRNQQLDEDRRVFLLLNRLINQGLGVLVFCFNIYFILVSDSPTEAVLNSVALAFIIEIDDAFKPNWDEDQLSDALAMVLRGYVAEALPKGDLTVVRTGTPETFAPQRNFYVLVGDLLFGEEFEVTVYTSGAKEVQPVVGYVTVSYEETKYRVSGKKAAELHDALSKFQCLENMNDIMQ